MRRRETDYLTFFGSGNYATDFNIHLRRLPLQERTFDSIGIERARTTYEYDSYSTDARHDALLGYANITGMDPVIQQASYTTRGNVTGVLRWRD